MTPADGREPDAGGEDSTDSDRGWESQLMTVAAAPKAGAEAADTGPHVTATKDRDPEGAGKNLNTVGKRTREIRCPTVAGDPA